MNVLDALKADLNKLKDNQEKVSREVLETKYHNAYHALRKRIGTEAVQVLCDWLVLDQFLLKDVDKAQEYANEVAAIINDHSTGWYSQMKTALFDSCDLTEFINICGTLILSEPVSALYQKYWDSICYKKDGKIYNELLGENFTYDAQHKIWWSSDHRSWTSRRHAPEYLIKE